MKKHIGCLGPIAHTREIGSGGLQILTVATSSPSETERARRRCVSGEPLPGRDRRQSARRRREEADPHRDANRLLWERSERHAVSDLTAQKRERSLVEA